MATIGSLTADLRLESAAFIRDLGKASAAVARNTSQMQRSFAQVQQSVNSIDKSITAWMTIRFAKQVVRFTEDALKLAATIDGPLKDSARRLVQSGEDINRAFKLGFASGFIEKFNANLDATPEKLNTVSRLGQFAGAQIGQFLVDLDSFITDALTKYDTLTKAAASNIEYLKSLLPEARLNPMMGGKGGGVPRYPAGASGTLSDMGPADALRDMGPTMTVVATEVNTLTDALNKQNDAANRVAGGLSAAGDAASSMGSMHQMTANQVTMGWLNVADTIGGALGTLFKDNKAVAIAQAVINTAQGITAALAQYPPPLSFAMAAAQAAAGAAQIAVIASTHPGSGNKSASFRGGGGKAASRKAGEASSAAAGPNTSITLQIKGDIFGPEHFKKMIKGINGAVSDGSVLVRMT